MATDYLIIGQGLAGSGCEAWMASEEFANTVRTAVGLGPYGAGTSLRSARFVPQRNIPGEGDVDAYTEMRDLVSDALQIITGTITDGAERATWIAEARAALGEDVE